PGADRSRREPVRPHADHSAKNNRREGPRRPLYSRSHEHHRGAGKPRDRSRRNSGPTACARSRRTRGEIRRLLGLIERTRAGENTRGFRKSRESTMSDAATKPKPAPAIPEAQQELTDGFHLVIDALKLNGIETIY